MYFWYVDGKLSAYGKYHYNMVSHALFRYGYLASRIHHPLYKWTQTPFWLKEPQIPIFLF